RRLSLTRSATCRNRRLLELSAVVAQCRSATTQPSAAPRLCAAAAPTGFEPVYLERAIPVVRDRVCAGHRAPAQCRPGPARPATVQNVGACLRSPVTSAHKARRLPPEPRPHVAGGVGTREKHWRSDLSGP